MAEGLIGLCHDFEALVQVGADEGIAITVTLVELAMLVVLSSPSTEASVVNGKSKAELLMSVIPQDVVHCGATSVGVVRLDAATGVFHRDMNVPLLVRRPHSIHTSPRVVVPDSGMDMLCSRVKMRVSGCSDQRMA